ncbi:FAD-binding domain-containing protein [Roseicyclus sp.]|uniref:FAD-binding domain-containing protein n=1 Tax=Roseicyclus sp. TaxID=1914329 RepID=UPI003F6BBB8F
MTQDVLVWFKRDLRIADNPVLAQAAARGGRVLPLFIAEPAAWAQADASARQWDFVAESLGALRHDLAALGAPLIVRIGPAQEVLDRLCRETGIRLILSHQETGNGWSFARDRAVAAWARSAGITWQEIPQPGIIRGLTNRDGWAARREGAMRLPAPPAPSALDGFALDPGAIPNARSLGLAADPCPGRQHGGRAAGKALLASFLATRGHDYRRAMSSPLHADTACARISPHLAWGTLGSREIIGHLARTSPHPIGAANLQSFTARLAWRDHFIQKLEDQPDLEFTCLHSAYAALRPTTPDPARLEAWEKGETGIPFVDACMRSLIATGWINFRMRAMLVSFASYHLWLDWRATGQILARRFTDYEPGIHWPQMQMQSGTTGINTPRIYNPVKQGHDQDPLGRFTRTWCPELHDLPDTHLHSPWTWPGAPGLLGKAYPAPIVDIATAARQARAAIWEMRKGQGFHAEASSIVTRHASRKSKDFVNDRAPKPRHRTNTSPGQLSFDL